MIESDRKFGLTAGAKASLLKRMTGGLAKQAAALTQPERRSEPFELPGLREIKMMRKAADGLGIADPYFKMHDGLAAAETVIEGKRYLNFSSYNYIGINGDPRIAAAVGDAVQRYGTSVSASRMVSGERPLHRALERALADIYGAEDCIALVSGHATNVTVLGHCVRAGDLIVHDELVHNSVMQGALLSGARRFSFKHNDVSAARQVLAAQRDGHKRAMLVIEGHYSMDGDIPDLPQFIALARAFDCWIMVDEAHSLGVLGQGGRGIAEHYGVDPTSVDLWMGTLSKSLVSCGGYIAGKAELIDFLKHSAPGFVYSVGLAPPLAASALTAIDIMRAEPERVARLSHNGARFLAQAKAAGLDTGTSIGTAIIPVITGSSIKAARLAEAMFAAGVNVQPILYPAVPERAARLRFFISSAHQDEHIDRAVATLKTEMAKL
jgi:8-amino-7-oxononanoate synthase